MSVTEIIDEKYLIIEPYYGGSHKKLIDIICSYLPKKSYKSITMSGKKWHWRARTSALYISTQIPLLNNYKVLFCTSVLPLSELLGLRPDLIKLLKIVYFHENQLDFPVRIIRERDFQYGYNEILTCLVADKILFNSSYNMESFLSNINRHLKLQPDYQLKEVDSFIKHKCKVVYYPLDLNSMNKHLSSVNKEESNVLHILWSHRWEFDKNPDAFYRVLDRLDDEGYEFVVSILGESFSEKPEVFRTLSDRFCNQLLNCGFVEDLTEYYSILRSADVIVSTAIHEFFGVSVLEAVYAGCIPVVPNRLSYTELFGGQVEEMYDTEQQLYETLKRLIYMKSNGTLNKNYSHIALQFESDKWFQNFLKIIQN